MKAMTIYAAQMKASGCWSLIEEGWYSNKSDNWRHRKYRQAHTFPAALLSRIKQGDRAREALEKIVDRIGPDVLMRSFFDTVDPTLAEVIGILADYLEPNRIIRPWCLNNDLCCVCGRPFTKDEWDDRHTPHEPDCHNRDGYVGPECECDLVCHAVCCPEYHP